MERFRTSDTVKQTEITKETLQNCAKKLCRVHYYTKHLCMPADLESHIPTCSLLAMLDEHSWERTLVPRTQSSQRTSYQTTPRNTLRNLHTIPIETRTPLECKIDIRIALSNTEIEIDAIGYVVLKEQIPNQTSFVIFS